MCCAFYFGQLRMVGSCRAMRAQFLNVIGTGSSSEIYFRSIPDRAARVVLRRSGRWIQQAIPGSARSAWSHTDRGERVFEVLKLLAGQTHLLRPYAAIIDDDGGCVVVEQNLAA